MIKNKIFLNISVFFNFLILKNSSKHNIKLVFYNNKMILFLKISNKIDLFIYNNNLILLFNNKIKNNNIKVKKKFEEFLKLQNLFIFVKIKFKGKGYKINIFLKKKIINLFFNHSHKTIIKIKQLLIKKISKNKFILLSKNKQKINNLSNIIKKIRKINLYTLRGLRLSKQIIFKRKGKKSSYI